MLPHAPALNPWFPQGECYFERSSKTGDSILGLWQVMGLLIWASLVTAMETSAKSARLPSLNTLEMPKETSGSVGSPPAPAPGFRSNTRKSWVTPMESSLIVARVWWDGLRMFKSSYKNHQKPWHRQGFSVFTLVNFLVLSREWMEMGVAVIIIDSDYGSFPHSLRLAPVSKVCKNMALTLGRAHWKFVLVRNPGRWCDLSQPLQSWAKDWNLFSNFIDIH